MTDHHHDHHDHPLTDKFLAENYSPFFVIDIEEFVYCSRDMRAVSDWQLEQAIEWLKDYTKTVEFLKHPHYVVTELKKAMRPQEDNS
jgi:hypothetical protein